MAKVKVKREGNLLWEDECQPLTAEQMNGIKSQFHPSNTANVNIVPYEIYDEDGEEIVVGEVRKTIDGVKKSKPLYEKIAMGNATGTFSSWVSAGNVFTGMNIISVMSSMTATIDGATFTQELNWYFNETTNTIFVKQTATSQNITFTYRLVFQYTKTTDQWQPV